MVWKSYPESSWQLLRQERRVSQRRILHWLWDHQSKQFHRKCCMRTLQLIKCKSYKINLIDKYTMVCVGGNKCCYFHLIKIVEFLWSFVLFAYIQENKLEKYIFDGKLHLACLSFVKQVFTKYSVYIDSIQISPKELKIIFKCLQYHLTYGMDATFVHIAGKLHPTSQ